MSLHAKTLKYSSMIILFTSIFLSHKKIYANSKKITTAVLYASHGDIEDVSELETYIKNAILFNGAIPLPNWLRPLLGQISWPFFSKRLRTNYEKIGGSTPYRSESQQQSALLRKALEKKGLSVYVDYGFNFINPYIKDTMKTFQNKGIEKIVIINQGAQYSLSTTQENINDVYHYLKENPEYNPVIIPIKEYSSDKRFIKLMKNLINKDFIDANYHKHESTCVLFATHGLPESLEKKGDPAVKQMRQLIREIELELDPIKVYHGFLNDDFFPGQKWTSPAVLDLFNDIKNSCSNILIDSRVSFTTHNKATLYELKYLIEEILKKNPLPINIKFSDSLAKNKEFSKVMSEIVYDKIISLNSWQPLK